MTAPQRSRWNQKQLDRIRRFIRKRLDILTYTARADKEEIESKVMEKIEETIAGIPDYDVERGGGTPLESAADSLALQVLLEQDFRREMGREACGPRAMPLFKQPFHRVENE